MSHADESVLTVINQTDLTLPVSHSDLSDVLSAVEELREVTFKSIECVYVDEEEIVRINKEHLNRDYVTDVISFHYHEPNSTEDLEGTVVMCAERITTQADEFNASSEKQEFLRIAAHGMLHISGLEDSSSEEKQHMTECENNVLESLNYA